MDDVEFDLRDMGETKWRTRVLDKAQWAPVVRGAKAKLRELLCYRRRKHFQNMRLILKITITVLIK